MILLLNTAVGRCLKTHRKTPTIVCTSLSDGGGGGEPPTKFSKGGGLKGPQFLKGEFLGKRGVTFFRGSAIFR